MTQHKKIDHHPIQVLDRDNHSVTVTGFVSRYMFDNLLNPKYDDPPGDTDFVHRMADVIVRPIKMSDDYIPVTVTITKD